MRSHELVKRLDFFSGQVNQMSGTTHWRHHPLYLMSLLPSKSERTYDSLLFEHLYSSGRQARTGSAWMALITATNINLPPPYHLCPIHRSAKSGIATPL